MTPFVLLGRKRLPPEAAPSPEEIYDDNRQLWVEKASGMPLVLRMQGHARCSQYGETTITETREGADQSEGIALISSRYVETTHTATREGIDQTEGTVFHASPYGETTMTKTREGADQTEGIPGIRASQYGETVQTRTREGVDQTEGLAPMTPDAPHSHF